MYKEQSLDTMNIDFQIIRRENIIRITAWANFTFKFKKLIIKIIYENSSGLVP